MNRLFTKALDEGKISYMLRVPQVLLNDLEVQIVEWVRAYVVKYGTPPTMARGPRTAKMRIVTTMASATVTPACAN